MQLHNRYGPTETAINVTHWACSPADGERSPIGRPLGNVLVTCSAAAEPQAAEPYTDERNRADMDVLRSR